jgi:hypothetical protein
MAVTRLAGGSCPVLCINSEQKSHYHTLTPTVKSDRGLFQTVSECVGLVMPDRGLLLSMTLTEASMGVCVF